MSWTRIWLGVGCVSLLAAVAWCFHDRETFGGTEVCTACGAESDFTSFMGIDTSRCIDSTPLSLMLASHGIPGPHKHVWLFAAGGPGSGGCALGSGRELWRTIRSAPVVTFLDEIIRYGAPHDADAYIADALDPKHAFGFEPALSSAWFPDSGFTNGADFRKWWSTNHAVFDAFLAEFSK